MHTEDIKFCTCAYTHTVTVEDEDKLPTSTESQEKESMECDRKLATSCSETDWDQDKTSRPYDKTLM